MKEKLRCMSDLVLGIIFIVTVFIGYYEHINNMWEYCFISGLTVGGIFIYSFAYYIIKKKVLPQCIYFSCMTSIFIIFIATILMGLNLKGAFWFIHIINPILIFIYWCAYCNHIKIEKVSSILMNLIFPAVYIIISFVRFEITGKCAFPADMILRWNPRWISILIIFSLSLVFLLLSFLFHSVNRFVYGKFKVDNK